jgi:hypothetical protein
VSFEVYVQFFERGEAAGVATADVLAAFPEAAPPDEFGFHRIAYGEQSWCELRLSTDADGHATAVTIDRPVAEPRLWDGVWRLLQLGNAVLYWPAADRPLVARAEVAAHLPRDMVEALGAPRIVADGGAIAAAIEE